MSTQAIKLQNPSSEQEQLYTGQTHLVDSPENIHNVVQPYSTLYVEILFSIISKVLRILARIS